MLNVYGLDDDNSVVALDLDIQDNSQNIILIHAGNVDDRFEITRDRIISKCDLIKASLEMSTNHENIFKIPVEFSVHCLSKLVQFLNCDETYEISDKMLSTIESKDPKRIFGNTWYASFVESLTLTELFELLLLANWLECTTLMDMLIKSISMLISDLDRKDIQKLFGVNCYDDNDDYVNGHFSHLLKMMDFKSTLKK